jgi:hypothetical protein
MYYLQKGFPIFLIKLVVDQILDLAKKARLIQLTNLNKSHCDS